MKKKFFLLALSAFLMFITFSNTNAQTDDLTNLKYFKIEAKTSDNILFTNVQKEMSIEPFRETFTLIVNISSEDKDEHTILFSSENSTFELKMIWSDISKEVRDGLLAWSKSNKTNMAN
jgi:hypothetical protein